MRAALQLLSHIISRHDLGNHAVHVQAGRVVAGIRVVRLRGDPALYIELILV